MCNACTFKNTIVLIYLFKLSACYLFLMLFYKTDKINLFAPEESYENNQIKMKIIETCIWLVMLNKMKHTRTKKSNAKRNLKS